MPYRTISWTNGWSAGQDGLVVMRWDIWLKINGFVTGCVLRRRNTPNRTSPTEWADIILRGKHWRSIDRKSPVSYIAAGQSRRVWWNRLAEQMKDRRIYNTRSSWPRNKWTSFVRHLRPPYGKVYHTDQCMTEMDASNVLPMHYIIHETNGSVTCNAVALLDPVFIPDATRTDRGGMD